MNFNLIWLKNRLYFSQIEQFSFDLAIEYLVDTSLFYPFARSQYEIEAFGDSRGDKEMLACKGKSLETENSMIPSAALTYITIIPAINPLSNQRLVCINYSLHKVGLHLRGDRYFEILYQCIQTLQNSLRMYGQHDGVLSFS